ncbi:MAG: glucose-6-phosphate isomerase [Armatimonadetes bacterium RBG_16_58_9]|nr:MAG: glucose-6-phosphate isomerase [Armatimonadetes bacterium RBG_16_58_9]
MIGQRNDALRTADERLRSGTCPGCDFTGWLNPDQIVSKEEMARLKSTAQRLRDQTDVLLVIGIGGSYLGARAVIEALSDDPARVVYAGQNISAHYMRRLRAELAGKRVAINVISKSGATTEPAIAFRVLKDLVGEVCAKDRIVATTDANKGALLDLANKESYAKFVVRGDVGGRYSVLSVVGLLPIAYAGVDVDALVSGAKLCADLCANSNPLENPAYFYACARNALYDQGLSIELLASFEPRLHFFAEWWKQLFGESEGKEHMALYPASVDFTTDLHSMGQYIQEGRRILAETFLIVKEGEPSLTIPDDPDDADGLNYLAGSEVSYVNHQAYAATAQAHREGGVPNMTVLVDRLDARCLGALIYFFEIACAVSGLMLGVNPFSQPGVEAYKKHMFEILDKPGFTEPEREGGVPDYVAFR